MLQARVAGGMISSPRASFAQMVMLQESPATFDGAVLALIEAAGLAAPLRKQERALQVDSFVHCMRPSRMIGPLMGDSKEG